MFRSYGKGKLYKASMSSITETIQETSQTIWSNLVARFGYDKTQDIFEGIGETILITMPIGFLGGSFIEGGADVQILEDSIPEEVVSKIAKENNLSQEEAMEAIKAIVPAMDKEVANTHQKISAEEQLPIIKKRLEEGQSPQQIALEISKNIGTEEAVSMVEEVSKTADIKEVAPVEEVTPEVTKKEAVVFTRRDGSGYCLA